ncbi:MAG: SCP2 sterol-binding domain-containing protein [Candidatus Lokiarchaeota archaeon]|nr:SCP2 sterol-binding domain-containing protein [Candidatus Lokiarchaeota archaeon]
MISIQKGEDLLSISLSTILSYRKDEPEFQKLVLDWNKKILIEIEDFYPIIIIFNHNEIKFKVIDIDKKVDLKVKMNIYTLLDLAFDRLSPVKAVFQRKLRIKGLLKFGILLKFMKIVLKSMQMVASDPHNNYFELNKEIK